MIHFNIIGRELGCKLMSFLFASIISYGTHSIAEVEFGY